MTWFCCQRRKVLAITKWNGSNTTMCWLENLTLMEKKWKTSPCWEVHRTKGTVWLFHSAVRTVSLPFLSCYTVWQREQLDSLLKNLPFDQATSIHDLILRVMPVGFKMNPVPIPWCEQSKSSCNNSLQAFKYWGGWCLEHRGGTSKLQRAFACDLWSRHPEVNCKAFGNS